MGIILALSAAVCFAISSFTTKLSVNKSKYPDAVGVMFQLVAGLACLLFAFQDGMKFQEVSLSSWILLITTTILYGYANILSFRCSKALDISLTSIITQMTLLFGFVGSILLFRETATVNKILGVLMILGGNIIVMFGTKFNKQDSKMIYLRILVCVMLAIGNLIDSRNGRNFPLSFYTFIGFFVGGIISYIGAKTNVAELKSEMKTNFWGQIIMGSTSAFGYILFLQAFNFAETSIVIPLSYINTIITVILGIVFLKERHSLWKKIIAIFIVFFGSLLINL